MDRFLDLALWIEVGTIVVIGAVLLLLTRINHLTPLTARPIRILLRVVGLLVILGLLVNKIFGVDLVGIILGALALVAVGVVAIWSLLSHITATILLILVKPFKVNDWIGFPGEQVAGKVVDLNLFYTMLENDESNEHFVIPNNQFFQKTIHHIPGKDQETIELHEQLGRSTPAESTAEE